MNRAYERASELPMSGNAKTSDKYSDAEVSVFADVDLRVRAILRRDLAECKLSREQVAIELSEFAGRTISAAMIDAFSADSKPHRFPLDLAPAWWSVTGSRRLVELISECLGLSLATTEDIEFATYGRLHLKAENLAAKLRELV